MLCVHDQPAVDQPREAFADERDGPYGAGVEQPAVSWMTCSVGALGGAVVRWRARKRQNGDEDERTEEDNARVTDRRNTGISVLSRGPPLSPPAREAERAVLLEQDLRGRAGRCRSTRARRAYAPASRTATRSPRRSGGRPCVAEVVGRLADGPLDRAAAGGARDRTGVRSARARSSRRSVTGAVQRRSDQLGHTGIQHDLALHSAPDAHGRGGRGRPASRPGRRATRPGSMTSRRGCRSTGIASSSGASSRAKRSGRGPGSAERADREAATEVERVEAVRVRRHQAEQRQARAAPHRATHRRRRAAIRRAGGCLRHERADPSAATRSTAVDVSSAAVMPNFARAAADGQPSRRLGHDRRGSAGTARRARVAPRCPARPASIGERAPRPRRATRSRASAAGPPACRGAHAAPQVGVGLADALEGDPVVRDAGAPRDRPLTARHDVRPEAEPATVTPRRRRRRSP